MSNLTLHLPPASAQTFFFLGPGDSHATIDKIGMERAVELFVPDELSFLQFVV